MTKKHGLPFKVFCIGFNKTGTTTIKRVMKRLGVRSIAPVDRESVGHLNDAIISQNNYEPALRFAEDYDGFEDRPWNIGDIYRQLDERFPGSRFILTVRSPESWWRSVERWISITKPWMAVRYMEHLGAKDLLEESMVAAYLAYNERVRTYFGTRDTFLEVDLEQNPGWEPFCTLLESEVPEVEFPHANRQFYDQRDRDLKSKRTLTGRVKYASIEDGIPRFLRETVHPSDQLCAYCGTRNATAVTRLDSYVNRTKRKGSSLFLGVKTKLLGGLIEAYPRRTWEHGRTLNANDITVVSEYRRSRVEGGEDEVEGSRIAFEEMIRESGFRLSIMESIGTASEKAERTPMYGELIRVCESNEMWQTERRQNEAARKAIKDGAKAVLFLDARLRFKNVGQWADHVLNALSNNKAVQVFGAVKQDRTGDIRPGFLRSKEMHDEGIQQRIPLIGRWKSSTNWMSIHSGGWGFRSEVLSEAGLFELAVSGGADQMISEALQPFSISWFNHLSRFTSVKLPRCETCRHRVPAPEYSWTYRAWAQRFSRSIGGSFSYVPVTAYSGRWDLLEERFAHSKGRAILPALGFNPDADLQLNKDGCWEWAEGSERFKGPVAEILAEL